MPTPRLVGVFFVYGLAFFAMGLAIALEARRTTELRLAASLKYLAGFGLLHGVVEWIDMWLLLPWPLQPAAAAVARVARLTLFAASTVLLAVFGTSLLGALVPRYRGVRWIPAALFLFWLAYWAVGPHLNPLATARWTPTEASCLRCHDLSTAAPAAAAITWVPSTAVGDIWVRYLIYLPASAFATAALWVQGRLFAKSGYQRPARDCRWMAAAFLANGLVAGLVVPPAHSGLARWLNYDQFLSVVGLPPQVFRAALAVLIAFFGVRILRVFDLEYARALAAAREGELRAKNEALEVARRAAEELEEKVRDRTEELFQQVRRLAILEERDRLAREMHDSLGQVLGFVNLKAKVAEDLIARGRPEDAGAELRQMRAAVQEAYEDVRQAILSLRSAPQARGLVAGLQEYVQRLREQTGLAIRLEAPEELRLPPAVEAQVIRIVQEALTNVRKHARARSVEIRFSREGATAVVSIADDGRGFDVAAVEGAKGMHFGLLTMKERAESIGGRLEVTSAPGQGTRVTLWIPSAF
ncbi:MAG: sensor histidine kinase [Armatimonadota bacterium]|nr:sensor histidine kinase [Armatimonadota bacterium]MDR7450509.1 sensor histidine kinase [Armatimonadota bacterium]MDR7466358.1 sensor histidine kinase [Armatimonadota bacterium]MDR7493079.1 sensor histidine kinase [Armatimonadota bacterium]MDR7498164.1 sensor histidine kinase [Armatimonadota bacterium]